VNTLSVLLVVDTAGALATGSLSGNCYMVDTNGYLGSWGEGTPALHTVCEDGQTLVWSVAPVSADAQVTITGFSGDMVAQSVCRPAVNAAGVWAGVVETHGAFASYAYTVTVSIGGAALSVGCYVKVA
jgi:hypothetical protein